MKQFIPAILIISITIFTLFDFDNKIFNNRRFRIVLGSSLILLLISSTVLFVKVLPVILKLTAILFDALIIFSLYHKYLKPNNQ